MGNDDITAWNNDVAPDFKLSLDKELSEYRRRSARQQAEPNSARDFRRDVEREYRAEMRQLREESHYKDVEISELKAKIARIEEWQEGHEETLNAATMIVNASQVFRITIQVVLGLLAVVGSISLMMDQFKSWMVR